MLNIRGTTSACAENTGQTNGLPRKKWNYLRVRGEYCLMACVRASLRELPPRARRILNQHTQMLNIRGTTSACAENTGQTNGLPRKKWNYLRVRGEYCLMACVRASLRELPPRARRILWAVGAIRNFMGTTSACAENTP